VISLFVLVQAEPPPFGLNAAMQEPVRATALLVAIWISIFTIPLLLWTPDRPRTGIALSTAMREGTAELLRTLRRLPSERVIGRFLLARMLYIDGLNTIFAFGGIYAAGTFGMSFEEILMFGIALNVTAGLGAAGFAWLDDVFGPKPVIVVSLVALVVIGAALLVIEQKAWFWALGMALGAFFGPVQSASRSLMARIAPPERAAELFGLYAFSGKATAFMGPLMLAWATTAWESQRAGMATTLVFIVVGLAIVLTVAVNGESGARR
jgi:UMF1 family MFS transporter